MPESGIWYLATKYTCKTPDGKYSLAGEEANFRLACVWAAQLIDAGWLIYSPIAHSHPIHCSWAPFLAREEHQKWYVLDNEMIRQFPFAGIILAPGWEDSAGCKAEQALFQSLGRQVRYLLEPGRVAEANPDE